MKNRYGVWLPALLLAFGQMAAQAITIDGDLNDWIATPEGKADDWRPLRGTTAHTVEDQHRDYLDPGYGGQGYDAEAIYVEISGATLYVAIVTGLSPDNEDWPAGDIAIDFGNDGSFEYGIVVRSDADNSRGGIGRRGEVYQVDEWNYGLWIEPGVSAPHASSSYKIAHPTTIAAGTRVGKTDVEYRQAKYDGKKLKKLGQYKKDKHYVIETAVSLSMFEPDMLDQKFNVHWTMACANDWIAVDPPVSVPEPPTLWMLGAGMLLATRLRYRQAKERAHRS